MVLAIYRYLNIILEMLIPKIYWFMDVTCKQKALREDKRTTEVTTLYIYTSEKPALWTGFWPTFDGM